MSKMKDALDDLERSLSLPETPDVPEPTPAPQERRDELLERLELIADKLVRLAVKLDEHLHEADAHNPGTLRK